MVIEEYSADLVKESQAFEGSQKGDDNSAGAITMVKEYLKSSVKPIVICTFDGYSANDKVIKR